MRVLISISILAARVCLASNNVDERDLRSEILFHKEANEYAVYHPQRRVWHQMHDGTEDEAYWYRGDEYRLYETVDSVAPERKPQKYIKSGPYWDRYTADTVDPNEKMINVISYTFTEVDGKQERMRLSLPSHKVRSSEAMARLRRKSYNNNCFSEKDQALIQFCVDRCKSGTPTHFQNVECCMDDNGTLTWVPGIWLFFDKSETRYSSRVPDICVYHAPENKYALICPPSGLRIPVHSEDDEESEPRGSIPDETEATEEPIFKRFDGIVRQRRGAMSRISVPAKPLRTTESSSPLRTTESSSPLRTTESSGPLQTTESSSDSTTGDEIPERESAFVDQPRSPAFWKRMKDTFDHSPFPKRKESTRTNDSDSDTTSSYSSQYSDGSYHEDSVQEYIPKSKRDSRNYLRRRRLAERIHKAEA